MSLENIEDLYQLAPLQQGILFHSLYATDSGMYFEQLSCQLEGPLDVSAFHRAWQRIIERHPILRTTFLWEDLAEPMQMVHRQVDLPFVQHDWRHLSAVEQKKSLQDELAADRQQGFDLTNPPLLRVALYRIAEETSYSVWSYHHLLLDGWSMSLLMNEFFTFYTAFQGGKNIYVQRNRPYGDYIEWLQSQDLAQAEVFWRQMLKGFRTPLTLGADKVRTSSGEQRHTYAEDEILISAETVSALQAIVRKGHVTLNTLIQGAWAILLSRYSGQNDIVFGATTSGRPADLQDVERMVGLFINTLPVRATIVPQQDFLTWVKDLQARQIESRDYEYSPLNQIQNWSELSHGVALFDTLMVFENYPLDASTLEEHGGLKITNIHSFEQTNYPLTLIVIPGKSLLLLRFVYDRTCFEQWRIVQMLEHLRVLLQAIACSPVQSLATLPMLTAHESQSLLADRNNSALSAAELCLHQLFEIQAKRTPEGVALILEQERLSYRELNARANQLAHFLRKQGVGPEVCVGLCVERSFEMLIGILGILKAGGAYVPLDPMYPAERLSFILADAHIHLLLTQEHLLTQVANPPLQIVCLDRDWPRIALERPENCSSGVSVENLAYVIYTSGSTGQPKGTLICHDHVLRLFAATQEWFTFSQQDIWTLFHSYAFDFSVWEIWGALLYGGSLIVVSYTVSRSPEAFYALLVKERVTVLNQTPSAFRQLIQAERALDAEPTQLRLRYVIFGGEALDLFSLLPWFERHGDAHPQLINMYGITETTVHVTYRPLSEQDARQNLGSLIGRPIPDLQISILDPYLNLVPIGVSGEIYVGGAGVARAYLARPDLTAARFIPDPFAVSPGTRLYRTGDLARYLPGGDIEYLGRIDQQVKIRGFRIELGEIEAALLQCAGVSEAAVLFREDAPGDKRLVAYLVPEAGAKPTLHKLRNTLKQTLPDYMLPASFVIVAVFPLTSHGKLDRKALIAHDKGILDTDTLFVAPRTTREEILVLVFALVLEREWVGIDDNFFALGGDSIRSIQVKARAQEHGLSISLPQIFACQTVRRLAEELGETEMKALSSEEYQPFGMLTHTDREDMPEHVEDAYPLAMLQLGMLFQSEYADTLAVYHDIFSYHVRSHFEDTVLQDTLSLLVARHAILRTAFDLSSFSQPLQLVYRSIQLPLQVHDLREFSYEEQERQLSTWIAQEQQSPFDWEIAPLLRVHVHRLEETFWLTLSFHHAILDGWSVASLLTELFSIYSSLQQGREKENIAALHAGYHDFVALEQAALHSAAHQDYWAKQLSDCIVTRLPYQQQEEQSDKGSFMVVIPSELSQGLRMLARTVATPLKSILLAAHLYVLSYITGQTDSISGYVSNGRPETTDGDRVLGLFLNTLPLRVNLVGGTWTNLIETVFMTEQAILPYRHYPLAKLQEAHGGQPLFDATFLFTHFHIYQDLKQLHNLEVIGVRSFERTELPLAVSFSIDLVSSDVRLALNYNQTLLSQEFIETIGCYYLQTLSAMVHKPEQRYETLSLLDEQMLQKMLETWNSNSGDYPITCVQQLFEAQVERTPHLLALLSPQEQMSYQQLNARANQLAHFLRRNGLRAEERVGICMQRSCDMIVAVLGILKAGGAYVPLDPTYPEERLTYILQDAQVAFFLTQETLVTKFRHLPHTICLDRDWPLIAQEALQNPLPVTTAQNLAYVIYTSGSTGQPKGVMLGHQGLCNLIAAQKRLFDLRVGTRVLQFSSFGFDAAVWETFMALSVGGHLYLGGQEDGAHEDLSHTLREQEIQVATLPPSLLAVLNAQDLPHLHTVVAAGERCTAEIAHVWGTGRRFFNAYGPTETTVCASAFACHEAEPGPPPIGTPILNLQLYVLDRHFRVVPIGVTGDLYIGGDGLARGYLNRPDLTAERFLPHPFALMPGQRLYRSGDLARYQPDGKLEYIGRSDQQVKIRGFRIELEEIETVIQRSELVRAVVVLAPEDASGTKRLVAYVVADPTQESVPEELTKFLHSQLPAFMVPSSVMVLQAFPLTAHGKVDRGALPNPQTSLEMSATYTAAETPTQQALVEIWQEVLHAEQIGIHDNFFALGGDSILSIQIVTRAKRAGLHLTPRHIFQHATIAELAEVVQPMALVQAKQSEFIIHVPHSLTDVEGSISSEFPLARLDQESLDYIHRNIQNIEDVYPLAPLQQGLLFHNLYEPTSGTYFMQLHYVLQGNLDISAFEHAWQTLTQRYAILRTAFVWEGVSTPVQVVSSQVEISLKRYDWRAYTSSTLAEKLQDFLAADRQQGFDVSKAPLMHLTLCQISDDTYYFIWSHHHLLLDGWSLPIIFEELFILYQAYNKHYQVELPACRPYRDYIAWLQLQDDAEAERFWRRTLQGFVEPTRLSIEQHYAATQPGLARFAEYKLTLSHELTQRLQLFVRQQQITMNTLVQGAWALLLHFYSGQQDIVFGSTVSGRPTSLAGIETMVGLFINTLPVRIRINQALTYQSWFQQIQQQQAEQRLYEHTPLVSVQSWSDLPQQRALFDYLFVFENYPVDLTVKESDLSFRITQMDALGRISYPLALVIIPSIEMTIVAMYDRERLETQNIQRLLNHFSTLLENIIASPKQKLVESSLLDAIESRTMLETWNSNSGDYPITCVQQLFEAQVERTPHLLALLSPQEQMSYQQLNARANQLAHFLRRNGLRAEERVGICMQRSCDMIVAVLGILKAGGAYVPLDPTYPEERLTYILQDAQVAFFLTQETLVTKFRHLPHTICLDRDWPLIAQEALQNPLPVTTAQNLAYVIYTSGSTGQPKGVMLGHQGLCNLIAAQKRLFDLRVGTRVLQFSSFGFDAAVWETFMALSVGGHLYLGGQEDGAHEDLSHTLREQEIQVATLPPSLLAVLNAQDLPHLHTVVAAGERCTAEIARVWGTGRRFFNAYGPTETTVCASAFACHEAEPGQPPIGTPILNLQLYILDRHFRVVPIGVTGDLYIGGDGLARGYLNRPDLTAERFLPHPFALMPGQRLYRSGDLARYQPDGKLEYIGRSDQQVKIRGFRIELEEIETVIQRSELVRAVVVLAPEDASGTKRLVAYVVADPTQESVPEELTKFLHSQLPAFMVPSSVMVLQAFPLTAHGKVDRGALPNPQTSLEMSATYTAAETPTQQALVEIWQEVLHAEQIGIHDNFFALGGDSILSIQIVTRAKRAGLHLTPRHIFQHTTIAELAEVVQPMALVQAEQGEVSGTVPLTPIQHWFFEQNFVEKQHWNQTMLLHTDQKVHIPSLKDAVDVVLRHHDALRLRFEEQATGWQEVNAPWQPQPVFVAMDFAHLTKDEQKCQLEQQDVALQASLNLQTGPLLRVAYFDLGSHGCCLSLIAHHLVIDAISWGILLEDFQTAYEQLLRSETPRLPAKTTAYRQWALRLQEYASSERLQQEYAYWHAEERIKRIRSLLIATDEYSTGDAASEHAVVVMLSQEETRQLLYEAQGAYNTQINDFLLTALAQTMADWMGNDSLLVDLEGHGREDLFADIDLGRSVGWFTSIYPLLLLIDVHDEPANALKAIKEQLRAVPNKGFGYGVLRYLAHDPILCEMPSATLNFNYFGQFTQDSASSLLWKPAEEANILPMSPRNQRPYDLSINCRIVEEQLLISWSYSENLHKLQIIQQLANSYTSYLRKLIQHCISLDAGGYTPSDFPLAQVDEDTLDLLIGAVSFGE